MFLKELKEAAQKTLFLELATLIMMAEGNEATTSQKIKDIELNNKSYVFFQNIDENEINVLNAYSEELEITNLDGLLSNLSTTNMTDFNSIFAHAYSNLGVVSTIKNTNFQLVAILEEKITSTLHEYSHLEDFKKELMLNIFSSGEDVLNINPAMIERFMLKNPTIKQDILRRTAKELIAIRQEDLGHFDSKEKKIILFELIGAGYSSGYFGDDEKSLLLCICESLDIENEYIEEFLEVSEKLFTINKELAILINE